MSAMHGYMDGSYDYRQMYRIRDLPGPNPVPVIHRNTLLDALADIPECSRFFDAILHSPLSAYYNDPQGTFTVFAPTNAEMPTLDANQLRGFLLHHTLETPLDYTTLMASRAQYLNTRKGNERILCECDGASPPVLNGAARIVARQTVFPATAPLNNYGQIPRAQLYVVDRPIPAAHAML